MTTPDGAIDMTRRLRPVTDAAIFLGVSRSTVYSLMDSGILRWVKVGKSRRVRWDDLERLIDENTFGGEPCVSESQSEPEQQAAGQQPERLATDPRPKAPGKRGSKAAGRRGG